MIPRLYCPQPIKGPNHALAPEAAHHALRVLRLRAGDEVVLFDGTGGEWPGQLAGEGRGLQVELGKWRALEREASLVLTLAQALPGGDKMDWVVQKAVELGVTCIQPLEAARSVVRLAGPRAEKRHAHWQQVAISACEQCGRNRLPQIAPLLSLTDYLARPAAPGEARLLLVPGGGTRPGSLARPGQATLLIGPEGGWTEAEQQAALAAGFQPLTLGPRVLRTETAGLAALAAALALWGDF